MPTDPSRLMLFLGATLVLLVTPGPAVLYIIARSLGQGRRAGLLSVAGIEAGNLVHCGAAAMGLAALLASSPLAFASVKYLGAAYLGWVGLRTLTGRGEPGPGEATGGPAPAADAVFRQAFVVAVLNPKTALFFLAFLPQFADPSRGRVGTQVLALGASFVGLAIVTDSSYALLAGSLGEWLRRRPGLSRGGRYVSGALYFGLGVLAAFAHA